MKEEILEYFKNINIEYNDCTRFDTLKRMLDELEQEQRTGHWIPVSERLPEKSMACLVAVGKFNLTQMAMYSDLMGIADHRIFYQGDVGYDNFEDITQYVKAWMPLPKAYKAEGSDKKQITPIYKWCPMCGAKMQ
jgi:hypothetical protein